MRKADAIEDRLSEKHMALWQWANSIADKTFTRKMVVEALGYTPRTIESIIKKLADMRRVGNGSAKAAPRAVKQQLHK